MRIPELFRVRDEIVEEGHAVAQPQRGRARRAAAENCGQKRRRRTDGAKHPLTQILKERETLLPRNDVKSASSVISEKPFSQVMEAAQRLGAAGGLAAGTTRAGYLTSMPRASAVKTSSTP